MKNITEQISSSSYKLLPGETIVEIINYPERKPSLKPSSLREILRLTGVSVLSDIGLKGPAVAAIAQETNNQHTPEHLELYKTLFGRDSLNVAKVLIPFYPELARVTTLRLAELQGLHNNTAREEEPGRIIHEFRKEDDAIAKELTKERGWGWPYYGSVDATPEFIRTLAAYCLRSEDNYDFLNKKYTDLNGQEQPMRVAFERALDWTLKRLSQNPEGLLEFKSTLPKGIENQAWKDSWDAYHHADGTIANHKQGVASIEVQVTTYDALLDAAEIYQKILHDTNFADKLRQKAKLLKETILKNFWVDEKGGYFALGTDRDENGNVRQLKIRTSNMGHALNSRLLEGDEPDIANKRLCIIKQIMSPKLLGVSGIRTLATDEVRYRPGAYHNGSVWIWDTHMIAEGLRRHKRADLADELDARILNVVNATGMFPEYVRGNAQGGPEINRRSILLWDELEDRYNLAEQPPQEVQGWTVAAVLAAKKRVGRFNKQLNQ